MFGVSMPELLLLLVVVLLVLGSNKLQEIGGVLGRAIRNFRFSLIEPDEIDITPKDKKQPTSTDDPNHKA